MLGVAHVLGLVLAIFGVAYVLPVGCSIITGDGLWLAVHHGGGHQHRCRTGDRAAPP